MPLGLGTMELLIVLVVLVLFFGSSRLPKLARSIGDARREFQTGETEPGTTDPRS